MELYVVFDSQGGGRLVGVFDDRTIATAIMAQKSGYYYLFTCQLNEIDSNALAWLDNEAKHAVLSAAAASQR